MQDHNLKFLMVSFETFSLLIQESYDAKLVEQDSYENRIGGGLLT
jgi:hypothetical protein